jgi:hypothetical protein
VIQEHEEGNANMRVKGPQIRGLAVCAGNNLWLNWSAALVTSLVPGATFLEECLGNGDGNPYPTTHIV